jgi:hypothetical protein
MRTESILLVKKMRKSMCEKSTTALSQIDNGQWMVIIVRNSYETQ